MPLKEVKNKIKSVGKIHKVTKAMEAVSAVKMRKSQERALLGRPYAKAALGILGNLSSSFDGLNHPLSEKRKVRKGCLVVITSDKGLAGSLNSNVLREAELRAGALGREHTVIVAIGKKAIDYFQSRGYTVIAEYDNSTEMIDVSETKEIIRQVTQGFQSKEFDLCELVYSNFVSTFDQMGVSRQLLPISLESVLEIIRGIAPDRGRYSGEAGEGDQMVDERRQVSPPLYEIEPSGEAVLSGLLPHLLSIELYHALLESRASEHSARMVAMKNASDKANDLSKALNLEYNKERQAQITGEVSEIVSGIETT